MPLWFIYAFLGALCASVVAILGKMGMKDIDSNLATAVRSVFMTVFLAGFVTMTVGWQKLSTITGWKPWTFIALSGVAGAASWLFQFKALSIAEATKVQPIDKLSMPIGIVLAVILLSERPSLINWLGIALITGGAYLASIKPA